LVSAFGFSETKPKSELTQWVTGKNRLDVVLRPNRLSDWQITEDQHITFAYDW